MHGPRIDTPIIRVNQAGERAYYHQDGLGSVVAVTDQNSQAQGTARYDAWGNVTRQTGGLPQYGYTGREPDGTGLIYARARYYDPAVGRFTQRDPIGLAGGTNLYAYAGGNPTNFTDPLGTTPTSPSGSLGATANQSYVSNQSTTSSGPGQLFEVTQNPLGGFDRRPVSSVTTPFLAINGVLNNRQDAVRNGQNNVNEFFPGTTTFNLLHNPSEGFVRDAIETFADKFGFTTDIAKQTAGILQAAQASGQNLTVVPHSQGGAIAVSAVNFLNTTTGSGTLSNISVACFACATNNLVSGRIYEQAGITNVQHAGSSFDAVPNIIGLNGNPLEIIGSVLAAPLLLGPPSVSPHTLPN